MERREGYLTKRGEVVNNWKRRYFVLEKDILRYYKTHADTLLGNPLGEVNVRGARVLVLDADDYGRDHIFGITPSLSSRTYIIAAESDDDRQQWVDSLCQMGVMYVTGNGGTGAIERRFSVDFSNAPISSTADSKVDPRSIREGFLVKQGAFMKNWKRRYFVLFEHTMQYYRHKGDVIPAGDIPLLAGAVVDEEPLPANPPVEIEGKFMFSVMSTLPAFSSRKYLFVADTEGERRDWIASIRNASSEVLKEYANMITSQGSRLSLLDSGSDEETGSQGSPSGPQYRQVSGRISMSPAATRRQTGVRPDLEVVQVKDGMLKKLGGFIKNWKRRYFVLESTQGRRVLKYFNSQVDGKALGEIPILKESTIKREAMNAYFQQHSFSLQSDANSRKYVFVADTEDQMQHWITAIHCATLGHDTCVEYVSRNTSDQKDMPEPVPEAPEDEAAAARTGPAPLQQQSSTRSVRSSMAGEKKGDVDLGALALNRMRSDVFQVDPESAREGWLAKVNEKQTAVQARYCILTGDTIAYYRTKPSRGNLTSNKKIPLRGSLIKDELPSSLPAALKLDARYRFIFSVLPLNSQRKFIFATDTEEDYNLWVGAIQEQVKVHEQLSSSVADSIKEGFLNFLNLKDYTWSRKYFVLAEKSPLLLRLSSQDADRGRSEAQLDLRNSVTQLVPNDKYSRANTFSVADGDDMKWVLSGDSREDVEDWVDAMMYSAEMHQHHAEQNRRGSADSAGWDSDYGSVPANYSFAMGRSAASIAAQAASRTTTDRAGAGPQPYNAQAGREVDSDFDD